MMLLWSEVNLRSWQFTNLPEGGIWTLLKSSFPICSYLACCALPVPSSPSFPQKMCRYQDACCITWYRFGLFFPFFFYLFSICFGISPLLLAPVFLYLFFCSLLLFFHSLFHPLIFPFAPFIFFFRVSPSSIPSASRPLNQHDESDQSSSLVPKAFRYSPLHFDHPFASFCFTFS